MNKILVILLLLGVVLVGGKRGLKCFFSLCINFMVLIAMFYLISLGLNPIVIALFGCALISYIVLYYVNGKNEKTKVSFLSVSIVLLLLALLIFGFSQWGRIGGFGEESYEEINMYSYEIGFDLTEVSVALVLIGLIGATIDASVAISSALYEVHENNPQLTFLELYHSGIKIGKDIIGTTTNTLLFAYLGEFMTLLIWFYMLHYSLGEVINAKAFVSEFIKIMMSGLGCVLIFPITSYLMAKSLTQTKKVHD